MPATTARSWAQTAEEKMLATNHDQANGKKIRPVLTTRDFATTLKLIPPLPYYRLVHPGPPFKSPVNTRLFSLFLSRGMSLKKPTCQLFANFRIGRMAPHSGRSDARLA